MNYYSKLYFFVTPSGVVLNKTHAYSLTMACAIFRLIHTKLTIKQIEEFTITAEEGQEFYHWKTQLNLALSQKELA